MLKRIIPLSRISSCFTRDFPLALPINFHCIYPHADTIDRPPKKKRLVSRPWPHTHADNENVPSWSHPPPGGAALAAPPGLPGSPVSSAGGRIRSKVQIFNVFQQKKMQKMISFFVRSGSSTSWYKHFGSGVSCQMLYA